MIQQKQYRKQAFNIDLSRMNESNIRVQNKHSSRGQHRQTLPIMDLISDWP